MFGHASLPTRIYSFDCKEPTNLELIDRQIFKTHVYRNKLVAEEYDRRKKIDEVQHQLFPTLTELKTAAEELSAKYVELQTEIKSERQKTRSRSEKKELRDKAKEANKARGVAWGLYKVARKESWESQELKDRAEAITEQSMANRRALRAEAVLNGVYWGNYQTAEAGVKIGGGGAPPVFHKYRHDGKTRVQVMGGISIEELFEGNDTRVRVDPVPSNAWDSGVPKRFQRTRAHIRIGSDENRKPIWGSVDFVLHREFPEDGRIKEAWLIRRHVGPTTVWKVQFTVSRVSWGEKATGNGGVGIDVGWRLLRDQADPNENGLRIAAWKGSDGRKGKVVIPFKWLNYWEKSDDLQEIRDRLFNETRAKLVEWLAGKAERLQPGADLAWLGEETNSATLWQKKGRLQNLLLGGFRYVDGVKQEIVGWRNRRFEGDAEIYELLEKWRKKEKHLYIWQECNRTKAQRWRDQFYHEEVAKLRLVYDKACVEETNWGHMILNPAPESDLIKLAGKYNRVAAVGRFLEIVKESLKVTRAEAAYTTLRCHKCTRVCKFDAIKNLRHTCEHCGEEWDQDENAAENLLQVLEL